MAAATGRAPGTEDGAVGPLCADNEPSERQGVGHPTSCSSPRAPPRHALSGRKANVPHLSAARERSENTARCPPRPVVHWSAMGEAGEPRPTPQLMLFALSCTSPRPAPTGPARLPPPRVRLGLKLKHRGRRPWRCASRRGGCARWPHRRERATRRHKRGWDLCLFPFLHSALALPSKNPL